MKTPILLSMLGFGLAASLSATPDHSVSVVERFFGSNETGYALIRTENDNRCSYYVSQEKTWLDEYSKDDTKRERQRSTLLLDVTVTRDAMHNDPFTPVPIVRTVNSKDETIAMGELLERYPRSEMAAWKAEDIEKLNSHPTAGIRFRNRILLANSEFITTVIFGGRNEEAGWRLDGVGGDMNCIYLRLSVGQDTDPQTRVWCISPEISKCVNDQRGMEELYLVEASYDGKNEAIARAKELLALAREKKNFGFHPEVWMMRAKTNKMVFLVVESNSRSMIDTGRVEATEKALGIDFTPMSNEEFVRKFSLGGDD